MEEHLLEKVQERKRRIEEFIYFGLLGEKERKTADTIYNKKQGNEITGSDVKELYAAISVEKSQKEKET